jgi:DNA-binding NarL/FixJ family response regulator
MGESERNLKVPPGGRLLNIKILLIDDFPLLREGFAAALETDPALKVIGQADGGEEGLRLARELQPDVVILDLRMPEMGGMTVLERLRTEAPDAKVLVVTATEKAQPLLDAVTAGAAGYLTKRCTREELRQAVITVYGGGSIIAPALAGHLLKEYSRASRGETSHVRPLLGEREHEVLRLVATGSTDKEIAQALYISPRTVQNHLTRVREKTGLRRRAELTRWAMEHALT